MFFDKLKYVAVAAVISIAPLTASAATISGQIDITGTVNTGTSSFSATGIADLNPKGIVVIADGDFNSLTPFVSLATLTDINFAAPGQIWSVGGFSFVASSFFDFLDTGTKAFSARGIIAHAGFDDTDGLLTFTAQSGRAKVSFSSTTTPAPVPVPAAGFLLVGALGGLAALRRRKALAA